MMIYGVYLGARTYGFWYDDTAALTLGADWLAIGMCSTQPKQWRDVADALRCCDDVPTIGFRDPRQQLDGPEYSIHVDGILL